MYLSALVASGERVPGITRASSSGLAAERDGLVVPRVSRSLGGLLEKMLLDQPAAPISPDALALPLVPLKLWVRDSPASRLTVQAGLRTVCPGRGVLLRSFAMVDPAQQNVSPQTRLR